MIKTEKGASESRKCIKKYQKELDEYIHSEKIKDDLGRLLGGFVPLENLIASAKFADLKNTHHYRNDHKWESALTDINDTVENILPIYEQVGDRGFITELKRKGLFRNLEKIFESDVFGYRSSFKDFFVKPRLTIFDSYLTYNIKKGKVESFWSLFAEDPLFLKNDEHIFICKFEEIIFEDGKFFRGDEFGELTRLLFFSIFSKKHFEKVIDLILSDFILKRYNDFISNFLLLDLSFDGDIYKENYTLFCVPNCFIDENLKNSKMLYFLDKFGHFQCNKYEEFLVGEFVKNLPLEKIQKLSGFVFTLCYSRGSFDGADWLKDELFRRLSISNENSALSEQRISLDKIDKLSTLYDDNKIINTINETIKDYFRNKKKINFKFDDGIESEYIPIYDASLLESKIDDYVESLKNKKVSYILDCSNRLFQVNSPFVIDEDDVFHTVGSLLEDIPKFGLRQVYCDLYKLNILKKVGYTPTDVFLFVSEYKWGANLENIDATFYNIKNLMNNHKELNIKVFVLEDIVRSFDPKDNTLDLELFKNETGLKEFQVVKSEEDMFDKLVKDGFEEIIFE